MKRCPECRRDYHDDSLLYCLDDGSALLEGPANGASTDEAQTAILHGTDAVSEAPTRSQFHATEQAAVLPTGITETPHSKALDKRLLLAPIALAVIVLGGFYAYRYASQQKQIESIAVMPFVNESGSEDVEYLSDGMTETLIKSLSEIQNLSVKPRSSVFRYKGKDLDLQTIAKELNVQAILTGRVVQRGDGLTLSLELIDAAKDSVIWTEQYRRQQADLVALQSEIARDVSTELKSRLSGEESARVEKKYTANSEAYQLYLKGRYHWNKRTYEELLKAIDQFKAAIEKDPNYAIAYAGLADTYSVIPYYRGSKSAEYTQQARPYAERAVELDDQSAETHTSLAFIDERSWNWSEAEKNYRRAIDLDPNHSNGQFRYARFEIRVSNQPFESLQRMKRALEIEPASLVINDNLSQIYLALGETDAAVEQARRTVELDPQYVFGWVDLTFAQLKKGQVDDALASAAKAVEVSKRNSRSLFCLGFASASAGLRSEAMAIVKELEQRYNDNQTDATEVAAVYAGLGDTDQAFVWLDKAFTDHSSLLSDIRAEYPFAGLHADLRFKDLLKRMNIPE